jgi:hypothetical protein
VAWQSACRRAGLPIGRADGFIFHSTRVTAVTDLRAGGMDEADAMKITGHKTAFVFRHYDLGDVDALRARLAASRATAATVTALRDRRRQRVARTTADDSCTATAQQPAAIAD